MSDKLSTVPKTLLGRIAKGIFAIPLAIWVFLEEVVWDAIAKAMAAIGRLPIIRVLESLISRTPPYVALILFAVPGLLMFPFKLGALWLLAHGQKLLGIGTFIIAKLIGTALLARIFNLTKPQLMTIGWFAAIYTRFHSWKQRLFTYVKATPTYQRIRESVRAMKDQAKALWRRFKAQLQN
jgi:hypothetical protein